MRRRQSHAILSRIASVRPDVFPRTIAHLVFTGTSQKFIDGQWSRKNHVASFVGFFPAGRPQVVISVIVDDADHMCPNGVAYGAKVAAPSFKRIGERLIPILNIQSAARAAVPPLLAAASPGGRR